MASDEQQYTRQMQAKVMVLRRLNTAARDILSKEKQLRPSAPYSSRIIKAGALIGDTKVLLSHWDVTVSVVENIRRVRQDNVFGKATRSRVKDILAIFRQRYLAEESVHEHCHPYSEKVSGCRFGAVVIFPLRSCRPVTSRCRYRNSCSDASTRFDGY